MPATTLRLLISTSSTRRYSMIDTNTCQQPEPMWRAINQSNPHFPPCVYLVTQRMLSRTLHDQDVTTAGPRNYR